jgi:LPXTG-motif cell wall-anchored protein
MSQGDLMYFIIFGLALVAAISGFVLLRGKRNQDESEPQQ